MATRKPTLDEEDIRRRVGAESFNRGQRYFRDGNIVHGRRAGTTLKADCHGSRGNLYRVSANVEDGEIVDASCSCPVGGGGHCKHVAALLLTWLAQPDDFREVEETVSALQQRSKEELIALVQQMLLRVPELETLLEVPLPTGQQSGRTVDPETYRRQVAAAFTYNEYEWGVEDSIADEVGATLEIGDGFLAQGDTANAVAVYQAVSAEVLENYESFHDESGALGDLVSRCVDGLSRCLEAETADEELREKILRALFDVYHFDVDFGGVGLGDAVPDIILNHANAAEKKQVVEWVRAAMTKHSGDEWSANYHRQVYGGFLLELKADELDDESFLRLCRETHRLNDLVDRLLALGRVDEASDEAERAGDYELLTLADIFVQHQQAKVAERLMNERVKTAKDTRLAEWLKERSKAKGDSAGALAWARKLFEEYPSLERYDEIHKLALELDTWQSVRAELLVWLNQQKDFTLLTEIHLAAKEIDAALATLKKIQDRYFPAIGLRLQVAQAAEATHPRDALRIYLEEAERIIQARNRGAYDQACQYLVRVRKLYQQLNESEVWEQYLQKVKVETKAMRAFKAEMAKAGL